MTELELILTDLDVLYCLSLVSYNTDGYIMIPRYVWQQHGCKILLFLEELYSTSLKFGNQDPGFVSIQALDNRLSEDAIQQFVVWVQLKDG